MFADQMHWVSFAVFISDYLSFEKLRFRCFVGTLQKTLTSSAENQILSSSAWVFSVPPQPFGSWTFPAGTRRCIQGCAESQLMSSRSGCSGMCQVLPSRVFFLFFFLAPSEGKQLLSVSVINGDSCTSRFQILKIYPNSAGVSCNSSWR